VAPRIDQRLLDRIQQKLGVGQAATYNRIEKQGRLEKLPRDLAAISLASELGININKFATPAQLAELRGVRPQGVPVAAEAGGPRPEPRPMRGRGAQRRPVRKTGNKVFVVHGRNEKLRKAMFQFLRATGVEPIEWTKAIAYARSASPNISDILAAAFEKARAVVVMLTPDDEAKLKDEFIKKDDQRYEKKLTGQARPNVLFEAGMAFGTHPRQTVLVEFGKLRPISDLLGRHAVRMDGSVGKRQEMMIKLRAADCQVDFTGTDWQTEGDFTLT
jgi:hypothetical protein